MLKTQQLKEVGPVVQGGGQGCRSQSTLSDRKQGAVEQAVVERKSDYCCQKLDLLLAAIIVPPFDNRLLFPI